jgi:hypothetical protein
MKSEKGRLGRAALHFPDVPSPRYNTRANRRELSIRRTEKALIRLLERAPPEKQAAMQRFLDRIAASTSFDDAVRRARLELGDDPARAEKTMALVKELGHHPG